MPNKESQEFLEKKALIDLEKQLIKYKHRLELDLLIFKRDSDISHHNMELERLRIRTAEIKKTIASKERSR